MPASFPDREFEVKILRSTAELEAVVPEWLALWHSDPHRTPFQRPEWLLPWWRQFGQPGLRAVMMYADGQPLTLLPFYIYAEPHSGERQLLLLGAGTSDYLDGVYAPACTPEHVKAALALLAREAGWDVAQLTQLRPCSPLTQALLAHGPGRAVPRQGEACSRCPALPVASLPAKLRADVRYLHNAAGGRARLVFSVAAAVALHESFDALVRLHTERWTEAGEPGVLADPLVLRWHREALPLLHASGLLRFYVLRRDGEIVAALYALMDDPSHPGERTAYFYLTGYSLRHAAFRPGTLVTALAIEHAANEGAAVIDMLRGDETYKKFWRTIPAPTYGFALPRNEILLPT